MLTVSSLSYSVYFSSSNGKKTMNFHIKEEEIIERETTIVDIVKDMSYMQNRKDYTKRSLTKLSWLHDQIIPSFLKKWLMIWDEYGIISNKRRKLLFFQIEMASLIMCDFLSFNYIEQGIWVSDQS